MLKCEMATLEIRWHLIEDCPTSIRLWLEIFHYVIVQMGDIAKEGKV